MSYECSSARPNRLEFNAPELLPSPMATADDQGMKRSVSRFDQTIRHAYPLPGKPELTITAHSRTENKIGFK